MAQQNYSFLSSIHKKHYFEIYAITPPFLNPPELYKRARMMPAVSTLRSPHTKNVPCKAFGANSLYMIATKCWQSSWALRVKHRRVLFQSTACVCFSLSTENPVAPRYGFIKPHSSFWTSVGGNHSSQHTSSSQNCQARQKPVSTKLWYFSETSPCSNRRTVRRSGC